jgi:hypothetical protein
MEMTILAIENRKELIPSDIMSDEIFYYIKQKNSNILRRCDNAYTVSNSPY